MEGAVFTDCIYIHLRAHAEDVKIATPLTLRAIAAAKKKDARVIANKPIIALQLPA